MTIVDLASFLQWMFAELLFNKLQCAHVLTLDKKETYGKMVNGLYIAPF